VRRASLDLPGGKIKTEASEILIRTKERRYLGHEYEEITIITNPDGTEVKLSDIAQVRDTFQETDLLARFDGMPAATVEVFRVGVEEKRSKLPESVHIATYSDMSELYRSRRNLLIKNGLIGLILVFFILSLFLRIRLAIWVMLGIPISFLGAILFMPWLDVSINMMSLFAFVMALGIVVDDAIIVGENIFEHRQKGKPFLKASVDGALEVGRPVTFAVLTSVAAFMPLLFVTGLVGKFIKAIPLVVISVLIISLIESLFILPAHLSYGRPPKEKKGSRRFFERIREGFANLLERFTKGPYSRLLELCLKNRYATLAFGIATVLITAGLIVGGIMKFHFMPEVEGNEIIVNLEMPRGTPVEETAKVHDHVVRTAQEIIAEYDRKRPESDSVMRHIFSMIGGTIPEAGAVGEEAGSGSYLANIVLFLTPSEKRDISSSEINQKWRKRVGEVAGVDSLTFRANIIHLGDDIDILISHEDFDVLERASEKIKEALNQYPGVGDIADTYTKGNRELKIRLKPEARTLGITEEDLGRQLRGAFYGSEALRLQRERNEVKVMVRYPEKDRKSLWDLESMHIRTRDGGEVPLKTAAYVTEGKGFSEINRTDRKRVVNVTATVDSGQANADEIIKNLKMTVLADLVANYPGLTYDLEGEAKESRESFGSMKINFIMALLVIYALLAIPFRSYSQPLLIMAAIPFGMVGAIMGHFIMGFNLSILSMFGMVALAGVVVNDSLLLIDYANYRRREGTGLFEALIQACRRRFRPILLTSLTTFFGLTPMILETSVQAQFLIPMAISLAFGVLFATGITLLFIPSLYYILEDFRGLLRLKSSHANHRTTDELRNK
jgi:multidrug efflux pump subunit AcrB